jgi:ATP-dependent helicase/nuclease subunit A
MTRVVTHAIPADHAVREQALDPTRSFIVEAPAGSGKTELLTRRYLRLLACVRAPEEILAITFTRKAAAEMRNRVLKALSLAENDTVSTPKEQAIWTLARAVRTADQQHGWHLLSHPARLRIMTIDALNSSLARQLPMLSGAGAALNIARDTQSLYAEVTLRIVERLNARDAASDAVARLLHHLDNQYDTLERLLSNELARREYWLDLGLMRFDLPTLRERLEASLREVSANELDALINLLPREEHAEIAALACQAGSVLNGMGIESKITACDDLTALPGAAAEELPQWRGIAELLLTEKGEWRKKPNKNQGFPPEDKPAKQRLDALLQRLQREPELVEALHRARQLPDARYSEGQWQVLADLLDVLKLSIAELELVMRERGEADYSANAIAARRALGSVAEPTDLALRFDYRLQHLLVDEFQDTSRGQVELLALLTAGWSDGDGHTLFCVGDPMQSIYRFRHADVGLFLNLKQHGLNQLRLTPLRLTVNFRSTQPVLQWVNDTFKRVLPHRDDPERSAVAFTASEPHSDASGEGGVFMHALVGDRALMRLQEAQEIAQLIERTRTSNADARIAVLASNRMHLQALITELQSRGIDFQAIEIDPLAKRPVIQDLIALTRALVHLADRTAWLAILRAPWCGLSLADLFALVAEADQLATIWQLVNDSHRYATLSSDAQQRVARVLPVLNHACLLRGRVSLRECVERTWHALGGPATVADTAALGDAQAFFGRLEEVERAGDLEDVVRLEDYLRDLYGNADQQPTVDSNAGRVELMTIHKAKGLEFDVVILPALDAGSRPDDSPMLRVQELSDVDEHGLLLAPINARGTDMDAIYNWLEQLDKDRARLEKGRLLYVAATRAERELHLFGAVESKDGAPCKPRANTFLHLLWPVVEPHFAAQTSSHAIAPLRIADNAGIRTVRLPLSWQLPAPTPWVGISILKDVIEDEPLHPEFEWVGETGRHVGTMVHREIERIARAGLESIDNKSLAEQAQRYHIELAELGVPPHLRAAAAARVLEALTRMLNDERGRWLLSGESTHREAVSELALSGVDSGEIVNGVIDRSFVAADGTRWIIDFKTSMHEGGGLAEFLDSEVERYRGQLQRYAKLMRGYRPDQPVKAALYFPLLKAWREVL